MGPGCSPSRVFLSESEQEKDLDVMENSGPLPLGPRPTLAKVGEYTGPGPKLITSIAPPPMLRAGMSGRNKFCARKVLLTTSVNKKRWGLDQPSP